MWSCLQWFLNKLKRLLDEVFVHDGMSSLAATVPAPKFASSDVTFMCNSTTCLSIVPSSTPSSCSCTICWSDMLFSARWLSTAVLRGHASLQQNEAHSALNPTNSFELNCFSTQFQSKPIRKCIVWLVCRRPRNTGQLNNVSIFLPTRPWVGARLQLGHASTAPIGRGIYYKVE